MLRRILFFLATVSGCFGGLYTPQDHVELLDDVNFERLVYGSDKVWVVEFYAQWCGHCQHFAPIYKEFGASVSGWSKYARIGVVHCPDNNQLCTTMGIKGFPTIMVFQPGSRDAKDALRHVEAIHAYSLRNLTIGGRSVESLRGMLAEKIGESSSKIVERPSMADSVALKAFQASQSREHLLVIPFGLDDQDSLSRAMAISIDIAGEAVRVMAGSKGLAEELKLKPGSAIVVQHGLAKERRVYEDYSSAALRSSLLRMLPGREEDNGGMDMDHFKVQEIDESGTVVHEKNIEVTDKLHILDLATALYRIIRTEVPALRTELKVEDLRILLDFLKAVAYSFPLPAAKDSILALYHDLEKRKGKGLQLAEYNSIAMAWKLEGLDLDPYTGVLNPKTGVMREYWMTCRGSSPRYRGYTCGLWLTLHMLTLNCHEGVTVHGIDPRGRSTCGGGSLLLIRDFISRFFTCLECRQHFAAAIDKEVSEMPGWDKQKAAVWLWKTHNYVNNRLKDAESTDKYVPKIQFPSQVLCVSCRNTDPTAERVFDVAWHEAEVYAFLLRHFSEHVITTVGGRQEAMWTWRRYMLYILALAAIVIYVGYAWITERDMIASRINLNVPQQNVAAAKALLEHSFQEEYRHEG